MAKILLIETATEMCSTAIAADGQLLALEESSEMMSHSSVLTLQIEACVRRSGIGLRELDAVCISRGPGSYTALRVGASVAKGICYAIDKPLIAVDTLAALAWAGREGWRAGAGAKDDGVLFVPMLEARRQEVWMAVYDEGLREMAAAEPFILDNNMFKSKISSIDSQYSHFFYYMTGNGCIKAESVIFAEQAVWGAEKRCSAAYLNTLAIEKFQLADFQDVAYFEPFYMKPPNITIPNKVF